MKDVNLKRLKDCMKRAEAGEELTIGFLGGSITQGSLATTMENTYAYRVFTWWKQTFPKANVHYVNGGIGGTTSHYGVSRAVTDVLMYQPDFVAINEQISNFAQTYPTNLKASSNEALLFMRRYRFANCSCFSCCFKDAYPSSNVQ